jgi:hypothetical protein
LALAEEDQMSGTEPALAATRRALHGVAELVLAGPQYRANGLIRLRVTPGGFGTVAGAELLAAEAGVEAGAPADLYSDGSGVDPAEPIAFDPVAAQTIVSAFAEGDQALRELAPDAEPVLWPEHFDLGISVQAVNYGVSPGDGYLGEPYAYVGPHQPRRGAFWNAPFGAVRPVEALVGAAGMLRFFREGRDRAGE